MIWPSLPPSDVYTAATCYQQLELKLFKSQAPIGLLFNIKGKTVNVNICIIYKIDYLYLIKRKCLYFVQTFFWFKTKHDKTVIIDLLYCIKITFYFTNIKMHQKEQHLRLCLEKNPTLIRRKKKTQAEKSRRILLLKHRRKATVLLSSYDKPLELRPNYDINPTKIQIGPVMWQYPIGKIRWEGKHSVSEGLENGSGLRSC